MQVVLKTSAAVALASLCCSAWAKAVTFEEIERANTVSGLYISHLSTTEMDSVEGSVAPLVYAGAAILGSTLASSLSYLTVADNPNIRDFAWHAGMAFTGGLVAGIAPVLPPVVGVAATFAAPVITLPPPPSPPNFCTSQGAGRPC